MTYDPTSGPKHAYQNPGRGRYYRHPITGEEWPSITNVLDTAVSKPALVPWAAKITAGKAWQMLPQMVYTSRRPIEREALNKEIKSEIRIVKDMAADLGSRVHAICEAQVLGTPTPSDPEAEPFAEQAMRFFDDFGVDLEKDVEAAEATVINRTAGYSGTGDLWLHLTIGGRRKLLVIDYKTSSTRGVESVYPEHGMQVAALVYAERLLLDNGDEEPPPGPIDGGAILNLRENGYALIPMPLAGTLRDAFEGFKGALATTIHIHSCYGAKPSVVTPSLRAVS